MDRNTARATLIGVSLCLAATACGKGNAPGIRLSCPSTAFPSRSAILPGGIARVSAHFSETISETEAKKYFTDFLREAGSSCLHIAFTQENWRARELRVYFIESAQRPEWNKAAQILGKSKLFDRVEVIS